MRPAADRSGRHPDRSIVKRGARQIVSEYESDPNGYRYMVPGGDEQKAADEAVLRDVPEVHDENGRRITIGTKVECGAGEPGYVTAITEPDESYGRVFVKWPEYDEPESFIYHGTGWCWEGPDVCCEVVVCHD